MAQRVLGVSYKQFTRRFRGVPRLMRLRYSLICMKARQTAKIRAVWGQIAIMRMLFLTFTSPARNGVMAAHSSVLTARARAASLSSGIFADFLTLAKDWAASIPSSFKAKRAEAAIFVAAVTVVFISLSFFGVGVEVIINGESEGFVSNRAEFESALSGASQKAGEALGSPYVIHETPRYRLALVKKNLIFDSVKFEERILDEIPEIARLFVLTVDGEDVAAAEDYASLRNALDSKLHAESDEGDQVTFLQDVKIEQRLAAVSLLRDEESLRNLVMSDLRPVVTHTVTEGETLESVASSYGISTGALLEANPSLVGTSGDTDGPYMEMFDDDGNPLTPVSAEENYLPVGENLLISSSIPFLSVCAARDITYEEDIPYETQYIKDTSMFEGDTRVHTPGVLGISEVTAQVRLMNGVEMGRTVMGTRVVSESVPEIVAVGTRVRYALGSFIRPYGGKLTSSYGNRVLLGRKDFHPGIDLAGPIGGKIVASDGGKVAFVGVQNGYGNIVIIDHQNGYKTAYAHCSKLLVSVGQMVAQGETIALVGNTGFSTGPHVHFEIRANGGTINPLTMIGK